MPEGDTIFRAARTLKSALAGKEVTRFETALAQLHQRDVQEPIRGRTVLDASSAGKHLLIDFSGDLTLRTHMRMNGSWHIYRPGERWRVGRQHMRAVIETADFVAVAFNVPVAEFLRTSELPRHQELRRLGPDFLGEQFDREEAFRRIRERGAQEIGPVILTQRVVAGIGNVFKSEVLFLAGINPFTPVARVTNEEINQVVDLGLKYLRLNVVDGKGDGIVTYTGFRRTTGRSDPSERLWVYGRRNEPCRKCASPIQYRKQGEDARSTYWCAVCQPSRE